MVLLYYPPFEQLRLGQRILRDSCITFNYKFIKNTGLTYFLRLATSIVLTSFCILQKVKIMMSWLTQHVWHVKKSSLRGRCAYWLWIVFTAVTIKKKKRRRKESIKYMEENMGDAGYWHWTHCSSSALQVKVKNVKAVSNSRQTNFISFILIVCFSLSTFCFLSKKKKIGKELKRKGTIETWLKVSPCNWVSIETPDLNWL